MKKTSKRDGPPGVRDSDLQSKALGADGADAGVIKGDQEGARRPLKLNSKEGVSIFSMPLSEDEFVAMRTARDATLAMPNLILPAIQINIRAGHLPPSEDNGTRYLKIPLNAL